MKSKLGGIEASSNFLKNTPCFLESEEWSEPTYLQAANGGDRLVIPAITHEHLSRDRRDQ